ncbi:methyltransferase domain-containing protein [Roseovarius aestuarii]|nr:methyltransferase domain-containing protein [Roseovarius aestuarii]
MEKKFLDTTYALDDAKAHYDAWTATYEAEIGENGYATPGRLAKALRDVVPNTDLPTLDFGCGTGLSGLALRLNGFRAIDGTDTSPAMLAAAHEKGFYHRLWLSSPEDTPLFLPESYPVIAAVGVIGPGGAPAQTIDRLMRLLPKAGLLAFSLNDTALEAQTYEWQIKNWVDPGAARLRFRENGPHLPKIDLNSTIYIIEKK